MGRQTEGSVNPFRVGMVVVAVVAGLAWWRWPDIVTWREQSALEAVKEEQRAKDDADMQARIKAEDAAVRAKAKIVGYKGVIDPLLAKKRLNEKEHSELGTAAGLYAIELTGADPTNDSIHWDDHGNVRAVRGHEAYFAKVYKKEIEEYDFDLPAPATTPVAASVPPVAPTAASWRTVAHYMGRSIKHTPTFAVPDEWRIRWKVRGDGIFQIYAYGPDGMPQPSANVQGADADESYMHGAGNYYLEFNSTGERYEVWVEERG